MLRSDESKVDFEINPLPREIQDLDLVDKSRTRATGAINEYRNCPRLGGPYESSRRFCPTRVERSPRDRLQRFGGDNKTDLRSTVKMPRTLRTFSKIMKSYKVIGSI